MDYLTAAGVHEAVGPLLVGVYGAPGAGADTLLTVLAENHIAAVELAHPSLRPSGCVAVVYAVAWGARVPAATRHSLLVRTQVPADILDSRCLDTLAWSPEPTSAQREALLVALRDHAQLQAPAAAGQLIQQLLLAHPEHAHTVELLAAADRGWAYD